MPPTYHFSFTNPAPQDEPAAETVQPMTAVPAELTTADLKTIQTAIDSESAATQWVIDLLCQAARNTQFGPLFRAAGEQHGEVGAISLLRLLVENTTHNTPKVYNDHYAAFCLAAIPAVAGARQAGKGAVPQGSPGQTPARDAVYAVAKEARERISNGPPMPRRAWHSGKWLPMAPITG